MKDEKKKLLVTIILLLVLILVMVVTQTSKGDVDEGDNVDVIEDDTELIDEQDGDEVDGDIVEEDIEEVVVEDVPEVVEDEDVLFEDDLDVVVNDGIIIEDITDEVRNEQSDIRNYTNDSLGLVYNYPSDWTNSEESVPGVYTVRVEKELEAGVFARFDLRFFTATVDTDNAVLTKIADTVCYFEEDFIAREVVTIPLDTPAELHVGEWTGKALQVAYSVTGDLTDEELRGLFVVNMGDFNTILGSLKFNQ